MSSYTITLEVTELPNGDLTYSCSIDGPVSPRASSLIHAFTAAATDLADEFAEFESDLTLVG